MADGNENSDKTDQTSSSPDEDALLMLAASKGDDRAFNELVVRHQKNLLNYFARLSVYNDVEDLVQQTFIRIYKYRDRYSPKAKFTTFMYLVARQVRVDEIRKRVSLQRIREKVKAQIEIDGAAVADEHPGILSDDLQAALAKLSDAHREVVVLGMLQEVPYPEIAEIMNVPVGTVKSRMHHALKQLRALLQNE